MTKFLAPFATIRVIILCIVLVLGGVLGSLTFGNVVVARATFARAEEAAALAAKNLEIHKAIQALRLERGNTLAILNQVSSQTTEVRGIIAINRKVGDDAIKNVFAAPGFDAESQSDNLSAVRSAYDNQIVLRNAFDDAMSRDVAARDKKLRSQIVENTDRILSGLSQLTGALEARLREISPESVQLVTIKNAAWNTRLAAGNIALSILAGLTDPRNMSGSILETITHDSGRVSAHWSLVAELRATASLPSALARSIDAAQTAYFAGEVGQTLRRLTQGLATGSAPGMTLPEFTLYISPKFSPFAEVAMEATREMVVQAAAQAGAARDTLIADVLLFAVTAAMALGGTILAQYRIARPMAQMTAAMRRLAAGDTLVAVPGLGRRDEIGAMAAAVQVFKDNAVRTRQLEAESALMRASAEEQRKAAMRQMADGFEMAVGGIIDMVSSAATELQATAQTMTATATHTARQSTTVAAAAEEAASNVSTVAAAAEELGCSVHEIGRQVDGSAELARHAVDEAGQTSVLVQELSASVSRIGDVVTMISGIAGQTNLLALNATIEAARAGAAGKGFAVVAAEVKALAEQTAKATQEISGQISRIQASTGQAVSAIDSIARRIQEISGVSTSIASAVEEQGAATQEIVRNVSQAAQGTGEVTAHIAGVAGAAEETGAAASQVLGAASELSRQSDNLAAEVTRFLTTVRAA